MNLQDKKEGTLLAQLRNKLGPIVNYFQLLSEIDKYRSKTDNLSKYREDIIAQAIESEKKTSMQMLLQIVEIIEEMEKQENNQ